MAYRFVLVPVMDSSVRLSACPTARYDLENFATASRWCTGVVKKTRRRSGLWITPTTVERVVAECTGLLHVGRL